VTGKVAPDLAPPSAVVVLEAKGDAECSVKSEPAIMDQAGYEFLPGFLLAQAGQLIQFRNSEDVLHNVR
jgi:plastocyanin